MSRAGSRALSIFTNVLNARILRAHAEKPLHPGELEEILGWAPQSSLRAAVGKMCEIGALARIEASEGSRGAAIELTTAGRELLPVAAALERWLRDCPDGPVPLDDPAAHGIVKTLTAAWDSTIVRALAEQPQTLLELNARIGAVNYPAMKRRLAKLRSTHLVVPIHTDHGTAYAVSEWLRKAVLPLAVAGRWEHKYDAGREQISQIEVEAAFLLALPLVKLPSRARGECGLAVVTSRNGIKPKPKVAGVAVKVEQGAIISCRVGTATTQATWALGTTEAWFEAVLEGRSDGLRIRGGKPRLPRSIVEALHVDLFRF